MKRKRQHKPDEMPGNKHSRFMFNLKRYYLSHQEVVEALERGDVSPQLKERFKNDWISVIAVYASAAHSYELDHAWMHNDERQMKKEIEDSMKEFRKSTDILKQLDKVTKTDEKQIPDKRKRYNRI